MTSSPLYRNAESQFWEAIDISTAVASAFTCWKENGQQGNEPGKDDISNAAVEAV
jgi:hypothetical protein